MKWPGRARGEAAARARLRSAGAWRAFDRINLAVSMLLAGLALAWWLGGPDLRKPLAWTPQEGPVRMRLSDTALDIRREGDTVVLRGQVRHAADRQRLREAAARHFGAAGVRDELTVSERADPLAWSDGAEALFAELRRGRAGDGVRVLGQVVTLSGPARSTADRQARERQARAWFGARYQIDNLIDPPAADATAR